MPNKKRLFLVDGMSNIFRSYYAIRGLSNSKGLPTNATYGFTVTLRKLMKDHRPDYLGVVLDSKEMTIRREKYADYKAHRPDMPEDLAAQLPYILRACEALRVPVVRLPRYEADDIIGALARQATEAGLQTVVVTNDKDLSQLVSDDQVLMLRVDKNGENLLNEAGVKAKYGVRPNQIVDWIGLMGDAVDGIPGAPGIGEKGAASLLAEFDTIENALANWEQVKKKTYRESLRDHAEQIRFSRELARIDLDVPVKLDLAALIVEEPDQKLAYELFNELEFAQLKQEFKAGAKPDEAAAANKQGGGAASYRRITKVEDLRQLIKTFYDREQFAFALSENPSGELGVVAFSTSSGSAEYFDFESLDDRHEVVNLLKDVFGNGLIEKSTHDLKRAMRLLGPLGVELENVTDDTLLQAYLIDGERAKYELPQLASEYLDHAITLGEESTVAELADSTGRLADVLNARILEDKIQFDFQQEKLDFIYRKIEMPLVPILYDMEQAGFRADISVLAKLSVEMEKELDKLSKKIYELAGREFNIGSPQQLGEIFEELNFEVSRRTATGKIATSRDVLDELAEKYELPRLIIEHRELAKLKGTYVDAFPQLINPADGRIHTTLNQTIAATGRLSSVTPNLQNIPIRTEMGRRIRRAFIPADGHVLLSADYSQIELRLLAHVTKDKV
ncbi:MAG TPA: DNA polymerase I, partial [Blastocatellia bacterium]|nr:DNA polymerase I [Blastocatellia bacterium]